MSWNYRIVKLTTDDEDLFMLREVYYDSKGGLVAYCEPSTISESEGGMIEVLKMMQAALDKPVINAEDFKGEMQ